MYYHQYYLSSQYRNLKLYPPNIEHSYIHTFIQSYIHTFIHSYIHTFIHSYIHTFIGSDKDRHPEHHWRRYPHAPNRKRCVGTRIDYTIPYTLHTIPYTLCPIPYYTLYPIPYTLYTIRLHRKRYHQRVWYSSCCKGRY